MARDLQEAVTRRAAAARERYARFRDGLDPRQRQLLAAFTFLAKFTGLAAPLYLLLASGWDAAWLRTAIASVSAAVLDLGGIAAASDGTFVSAGHVLVDVTRDSTGWKSVLALAGLILASRRPWREKGRGLVIGAALVMAVNVIRIVSMVAAVVLFDAEYEFLHLFLWRWGLTGAVIAVWAAWFFRIDPRRALAR